MSGLTRNEFEALWARLDADAVSAKESQRAVLRLQHLYAGLDDADRAVVNDVVSEWALLDDPAKFFDAISLIRAFAIHAALPALRTRLEVIGSSAAATERDEREWLQEVIAELEAKDAP